MANQGKIKASLPWHEKLLTALLNNLKVTLAGAVLLVLVSVALASRGCGDGGSERPSGANRRKASRSVSAKVTVTTPTNALPEPEPPAPPPNAPRKSSSSPPSRQTQRAKPEKAVRPKDVADWKRGDYEGAARDGDPQLVAALGYFGPHFAGKESAANFLAKLLEASDAAPVADNTAPLVSAYRRGGNSSYGKRKSPPTEAIMAALVVNGTPRARQILESIVDGSLTTAGQQAAAVDALKSLATHPGPETEDLLFRLVTAPEAAAGDPATNKTAQLRNTAMALIRTGKFASLSVRLAKWMLATETSKALHDQLWACLKEPRPENLPAQILLYQSDRPDPAMHAWLEQWLVTYGSDALGRLLGIPAGQTPSAPYASFGSGRGGLSVLATAQRRGTLPSTTVPAANAYRLAELLWSSRLAAVTEQRLADLETLTDGLPLITLASTVPHPTVRAALLRTLERHWEEGPKPLHALSTTQTVNLEPGFVTLLKMLPRSDAVDATTRKDLLTHGGNHSGSGRSSTRKAAKQPGPSGQETQKNADLLEAKHRHEQLGKEWMEFSRAVSQAICRRFSAAARADESGRSAGRAADDAGLSFKLPPGAKVSAAYQVSWPAALDGKLAAAPVLRVHYVRIDETAAPAKVLAYYRRQVPHAKEHLLAGGGWIDSIASDGEQGHAASVDVLVAKVTGNDAGLANEKQELTVDILTIECDGIAKRPPLSASR